MNLSDKVVFIGDSYGQGYTPEGQVKSWIKYTTEKLPLQSSQVISSSLGGAGFGRTDSAYKFSTLLNNLSANNNVKFVVIGGGYNDIYSTSANIDTDMALCKSIVASKFPNATMCVAFIGNTTNTSLQPNISTARGYWQSSASTNNITFLNNVNVLTNSSLFASDGIHPNEQGEITIANAVSNAMDSQL